MGRAFANAASGGASKVQFLIFLGAKIPPLSDSLSLGFGPSHAMVELVRVVSNQVPHFTFGDIISCALHHQSFFASLPPRPRKFSEACATYALAGEKGK